MFIQNRLHQVDISSESSRNAPRQSRLSPDLSLLLSLIFLTTVIMMIAISTLPKPRLENHSMCGVTTGGQDECYFDCTLVPNNDGTNIYVKDLSCMEDCFEKEPNNCVTSLLNDVIGYGVCDTVVGIYPVNETCEFEPGNSFPSKGTCSDKTEAFLLTDECFSLFFEQQAFIRNTLFALIISSCREEVSTFYFNFMFQNNIARSKTRLAPVQLILEDLVIRTKLEYENTRNRYPWVCSLRSQGPFPVHQCAVNLLSIPPSPTILVGAAHCTYLCKDGTREVPVCCCSFGTDNCRDRDPRCGDNPEVFEMTGADSIIECGEWDTSQATSLSSGERYNVKLPILEIVRHPNFDPTEGPINGNDIVIFKVDDKTIQNNVANTLQLWPVCISPETNENPKSGIHTGWSQPPSFPFIQSQAPGFGRIYNDFYKQWHYKMDILDVCEDPKDSIFTGQPLQYPSNSSYPAGTVCAKDFTRDSCFSTGDSGSPLMVKYGDNKHYIEGILSFVKGCDQFDFGPTNEFSDNPTFILNQRSENPTTYTKLSCFLPWVASQYNMKYEVSESQDQVCLIGTGDPEDGNKTCRNTPSDWAENPGFEDDQEVECKFPFYYDGKKYEECILFNEDDFLYPIFRCPIRDITTKIDGINSFNSSSLTEGYCLFDPFDEESPLDPELFCFFLDKRPPFSQCKNNCPGVKAFGIIGGGAVLAGVATAGVLSTASFALPAAAAGVIGLAGIGGGMLVAQNTCAGPFFCLSASGRCCVVINSSSGFVCPDTCSDLGL